MIEHTLADGIATLRLASPASANALTPAAYAELARQLQALLRPDSGARVLVLTGSGRVFSAGANLDVLGSTDTSSLADAIVASLLPVQRALADSALPTIAAVNGTAVGGAVGLALMCDFVMAARSARFSLAFARLGLVPDTGLTQTLPRLVGEARARAWLMAGAQLSADEAASAGMIYRAIDDADFDHETLALARRLAALPSGAHRLTRASIVAGRENSAEAQLRLEAAQQASRVTSDEFRTALAAFAARRKG